MGDRVSLGAFVTVVSDQGPPTPTGVFFFWLQRYPLQLQQLTRCVVNPRPNAGQAALQV